MCAFSCFCIVPFICVHSHYSLSNCLVRPVAHCFDFNELLYFWCCRYKLRITLFSRVREKHQQQQRRRRSWQCGKMKATHPTISNSRMNRINKKFPKVPQKKQLTKHGKKWLNHKNKIYEKKWEELKREKNTRDKKNQTAHLYVESGFFLWRKGKYTIAVAMKNE